MRHFFLDELTENKGLILDPVDVHHISRVLRMRVGEEVSVAFEGRAFYGKIASQEKNYIEIDLNEAFKREDYPKIHLYQALAKGQKIEEILQHGTELGIARFGLFPSRYSDVKNVEKKLQRYRRIIKDAAKQSVAFSLPELRLYNNIDELELDEDQVFFCYEREKTKRIRLDKTSSVGLIIGPEGGFSEDEATRLSKRSQPVSLGERTLRTETAGLVATTIVLREFGVL